MSLVPTMAQIRPVEPVFTATTTMSRGQYIKDFGISSSDYFWVDWGDGNPKKYNKGTYNYENPCYAQGGIKGKEIKIYGESIFYIVIKNAQFTSAKVGFSAVPTHVELTGNPLKKIDVEECQMLKALVCPRANLTELKLGKKNKLELLNIAGNQLTEIDLSQCPALVNLDISDNNISGDIILTENASSVSLSNNKIKNVELGRAKKLEYFTARNNLIESIEFPEIYRLIMVDLNNNRLNKIKFAPGYNYEKITSLLLSENQLQSIDLSPVKEISALDVSHNHLKDIKLNDLSNITSLSLGFNDISILDLSNCAKLRILNAEHTNLQNIDFTKCFNIAEIRAEGSQINTISLPETATNLIHVDMRNNKMNKLSTNALIERLPDVTEAHIYDWEKDWKQHLNLAGNNGAEFANLEKAKELGWILDIEKGEEGQEREWSYFQGDFSNMLSIGKGIRSETGKSCNYSCAIKIPAGTCESIKAVKIALMRNKNIGNVKVWISKAGASIKDIDKEIIKEKAIDISQVTGNTINAEFNEAVNISNEETVYVGYSFTVNSVGSDLEEDWYDYFPIAVENSESDAIEGACYYFDGEWKDLSGHEGSGIARNLAIKLIVK